MWWSQKPKPIVLPAFSPIAHPLYPVVFDAYGTTTATPRLTHRLTLRRLPGGVSSLPQPGKIIADRILAEERRWEDREHWQRFLLSAPTHALQVTYTINSEPSHRRRELVHAWINCGLHGWDSNSIAIEIGEFLVFSINEMQMPGVLSVRNVGSASTFLILAFTRYRAILVKAGIASDRVYPGTVKGYKLTGDF